MTNSRRIERHPPLASRLIWIESNRRSYSIWMSLRHHWKKERERERNTKLDSLHVRHEWAKQWARQFPACGKINLLIWANRFQNVSPFRRWRCCRGIVIMQCISIQIRCFRKQIPCLMLPEMPGFVPSWSTSHDEDRGFWVLVWAEARENRSDFMREYGVRAINQLVNLFNDCYYKHISQSHSDRLQYIFFDGK